ncbi:MAG: methionyl-tRNA formyltransferase [Lentimicrobiaceae bacterium]|jgi:methionyl-tRNA formyltransferase|nr:methionyl-tRNA formyltransferase [Lentimicrobiaceae bacterium]MCP4911453.1 methionyl-tRNA formyltransferase [Bacteroidota bacterium]MBT3454599.1 methionyl-tRNA formyltransferase [Lentimicrobiaceae bacterium]MBT3818297.1 methionyl-tRNA formyltransferase [Lentimicrobiaceae bacterium]MBT4062222.1 methionyl-tRNA formyltransferase [Lentimicrobiaceae bacterium]
MDKKDLRIVFMGTPEFAVAQLEAIIDSGYNVVGVVTSPDRKAGRGRKMKMSAVKAYAQSRNLNILQPTNLKDDIFIQDLKDLKPNLQVVVAFRMLPKIVWNIPTLGTFNLHASLLPQYRGAAPINYAIINGENETGLTTFLIDDKIDTGEILLQKKVKINDNDDAGDLHDRLMKEGCSVILDTIEGISTNSLKPVSQMVNNVTLKNAHKISKEDCKINWHNPSHIIRNFIRGLSPYPAAHSILKSNLSSNEMSVKIYKVEIAKKVPQEATPGTIFSDDKTYMSVATTSGTLNICEIQIEGKRRMKIEELLRGFSNIQDYTLL